MNRKMLNQRLPEIVNVLVKSVTAEPKLTHLNRVCLPSRDAIIECIKRLRQLLFPGYFGRQVMTSENIPYRIGELVIELSDILYDQVRSCLRYREQLPECNGSRDECAQCDQEAAEIVSKFFHRLPAVRELLATDVQAAFDSDPAAQSTDETVFCYPGLFAISVQRMAHEFYNMGVPLLPRIMTEYAHSETGVDIHPGAKLGKSFFIDHGTGIVIGETSEIGNNVKIYQGVTLGGAGPGLWADAPRPETPSHNRGRCHDLCRRHDSRRRHGGRPRRGDQRQRLSYIQRPGTDGRQCREPQADLSAAKARDDLTTIGR